MKKATRIVLGSATLTVGLAFGGAARANAQVRFEGSFPLPHGRISVNVTGPAFSVGAFVPEAYSVYQDPDYGYGFVYGDQWISCEPYGSRWIIAERRPYFGHRAYGYARPSQGYRYGYSQRYRRDDINRRFGRENARFQNNRSFGRETRSLRDNRGFRRENRQSRDNRSYGRQDRRSWGRDRRWNR